MYYLPDSVIFAIKTAKDVGVDPLNVQGVRQEACNRGIGEAGNWIGENTELYVMAVSTEYAPLSSKPVEEPEAPKKTRGSKQVAPPADEVIAPVVETPAPETPAEPPAEVVPTA